MSTRLDLVSLGLFIAVAEERSIAQAAARAHIVASAASKRLAALESELGVALLKRHAKGVDLTPAGVALLARARDIVRSVELTASEVGEFAADGYAQIRLAANHSSIVQFLAEDLKAYLGAHPRTKIDLTEMYSVEAVRAVADGGADVGIYCAPVAPHGVVSLPYRRDELVVAVRRGHPLARRSRIDFISAVGYDFVGFFPTLSIESVYPALANRAHSRVRVQIANFDGTCRMVEAGLGIALVPFAAAEPHFTRSGLVPVRLKDDWARRQLHLCVRESEQARPSARELADFLAARAAASNG
ncbi:MAG TPA: LysR family transcriptional regulator [Ramlibacter sp.]|nr:LysR family transcriptional regulator [Ramlibacter sp.]